MSKAKRVLLVEDDPHFTLVLQDNLQRSFRAIGATAEITAWTTLHDAWSSLCEGGPWDLLVTDLGLEGHPAQRKGKDLIGRAGADDIPVIVVSGVVDLTVEEIADLYQKHGARAVFIKGKHFNLEDLTTQIRRIVRPNQASAFGRGSRIGGGSARAPNLDATRVFLVHGRDEMPVRELQKLLTSMRLKAWSFDDAAADLGGSPFVGDVVRHGMERSQAVLVLFTPDERASLDGRLVLKNDKDDDLARRQARPNVIFEAGLALGLDSHRVIMITVGANVSLFSNLGGRRLIALDNEERGRRELRKQLEAMGCPIDLHDDGWKSAGDFSAGVRRRHPTGKHKMNGRR